jgi:hypothetical protein
MRIFLVALMILFSCTSCIRRASSGVAGITGESLVEGQPDTQFLALEPIPNKSAKFHLVVCNLEEFGNPDEPCLYPLLSRVTGEPLELEMSEFDLNMKNAILEQTQETTAAQLRLKTAIESYEANVALASQASKTAEIVGLALYAGAYLPPPWSKPVVILGAGLRVSALLILTLPSDSGVVSASQSLTKLTVNLENLNALYDNKDHLKTKENHQKVQRTLKDILKSFASLFQAHFDESTIREAEYKPILGKTTIANAFWSHQRSRLITLNELSLQTGARGLVSNTAISWGQNDPVAYKGFPYCTFQTASGNNASTVIPSKANLYITKVETTESTLHLTFNKKSPIMSMSCVFVEGHGGDTKVDDFFNIWGPRFRLERFVP